MSGMEGEEGVIALPGEKESPEKSIAEVLNAQFLSKEFEYVFGSTELREHEIIGLAPVLTCRYINQILATSQADYDVALPEEKGDVEKRLVLKEHMLSDPNAMMYAIQNVYVYTLSLGRRSLTRKSRQEGVIIGTTSLGRAMAAEDIGFGQRMLAGLGLGRYKTAYIPKREQ